MMQSPVHVVLSGRDASVMDLLAQPLATAEFVAVDTETNGPRGRPLRADRGRRGARRRRRAARPLGDARRCGAPLSRGIQRFTRITQAMVDEAPAADAMLPELAELAPARRVLVAHNAAFDRRVLRQAFARAGLDWPDPPAVHGGAGAALRAARAPAPAARARRLARHRGRSDAPRAGRRRDLRARVLRAVRAAVRERGDGRRRARGAAARPARPRPPRARRTARARVPSTAARRPGLQALPDEPGVYIFRNAEGQPLYVGKSVALRTRARAHFHAARGRWATGGRRRRSSSTTAPRTPSSARSCSSTA